MTLALNRKTTPVLVASIVVYLYVTRVLFHHVVGVTYPTRVLLMPLLVGGFIGLVFTLILCIPAFAVMAKTEFHERYPAAMMAAVAAGALLLFVLMRGIFPEVQMRGIASDVWGAVGKRTARGHWASAGVIGPLNMLATRALLLLSGITLFSMAAWNLYRRKKEGSLSVRDRAVLYAAPSIAVFLVCMVIGLVGMAIDASMIGAIEDLRSGDVDERVTAVNVLMAKGDFRCLPDVSHALVADADKGVRVVAAGILGKLGHVAEKAKILDGLKDGEGDVRAAALDALQQGLARETLSDSAARSWSQGVKDLLSDPEPNVARKAADLLIAIGPRASSSTTKKLGSNGVSEGLALEVLARVGDDEALGYLMWELDRPEGLRAVQGVTERDGVAATLHAMFLPSCPAPHLTQASITLVLVGMGPTVRDQLAAVSLDRELRSDARAFALRVLIWRRDNSTVETVIAELAGDLHNGERGERFSAARILELAGGKAVGTLVEALKSDSEQVRKLADKALYDISKKNYSGVYADWLKWWQGLQPKLDHSLEIKAMIEGLSAKNEDPWKRKALVNELIIVGEPAVPLLIETFGKSDKSTMTRANHILKKVTGNYPVHDVTLKDALGGKKLWQEWYEEIMQRRKAAKSR